jgi:hypothetical protein
LTNSEEVDIFAGVAKRKLKKLTGDYGVPDEDELICSPKKVIDLSVNERTEKLKEESFIIKLEEQAKEEFNKNFESEAFEKVKQAEQVLAKKYTISSKSDSIVKVPEGCKIIFNSDSTDDYDLKFFIELINEEPIKSNGWSTVIDDKNIGIFKKAVK